MRKKILVTGAGGFIGSHMVKRLRAEGYWVRGVDLKYPEYSKTEANEFVQGDLRDVDFVRRVLEYKGPYKNFYNSVPYRYILPFHEIYQFAADMGGAGFVFTGENDAEIMHNSATINLNVLEFQHQLNKQLSINKTKIFYSGSACMYPAYNQEDPLNPNCKEDSAYPAAPDSRARPDARPARGRARAGSRHRSGNEQFGGSGDDRRKTDDHPLGRRDDSGRQGISFVRRVHARRPETARAAARAGRPCSCARASCRQSGHCSGLRQADQTTG